MPINPVLRSAGFFYYTKLAKNLYFFDLILAKKYVAFAIDKLLEI